MQWPPLFDFRAYFCHSAPMETHAFGFTLRANAPEGQKRLPIGTQVFAIRSGAVIDVTDSFTDGDNTGAHVNFVLVRHDDGTVARYAHLTFMGAIVQLGDGVAQGQLIALSGNTGRSTAPHLHFDVTTDCCTPNPDGLPIGQSIPLNFRNAEAVPGTGGGITDLSCGLRPGVAYTALPF